MNTHRVPRDHRAEKVKSTGPSYKLSVREFVDTLEGKTIEKYPAFDAKLDKAPNFTCSKDQKPRTFLDDYVKKHSLDPGPKYAVELDMTKKAV